VKVIYVAGPFRCASQHMPGQQDGWGIQQNVMRAMELALEVWRRGAAAVCPHANTMFFQNAAKDEVWLDGDLAILEKCDAVLMTPDWERSSGARAEHAFALQHGITVLYTLADVENYIACQ
jgi:nucleoside 2-deoxyribosyltransferase